MVRLNGLLSAKHPLDKNSDAYLEGKDVIKVVHSLASGSEQTQFAFTRNTLVAHANDVIQKLSACLNMSFVCSEAQVSIWLSMLFLVFFCFFVFFYDSVICEQGEGDVDVTGVGAGGIDVQLLSVCLAALMALFRLPELCREVCVLSEIK